MVHFLIGVFVALTFCVCFSSFVYCYTCMPLLSVGANGQLRSLSGIMKAVEVKPYFCFVMGCLGGSLFIATGVRSFDEKTEFQRVLILVLSLGMYMCLTGVVNYDLTYSKDVHLCFFFVFFVLGCVFSCVASDLSKITSDWKFIASVLYNVSVSLFLLCTILNFYAKSQGFTDYRTVQSYLEIIWVVSLVFMLNIYAFESDG